MATKPLKKKKPYGQPGPRKWKISHAQRVANTRKAAHTRWLRHRLTQIAASTKEPTP